MPFLMKHSSQPAGVLNKAQRDSFFFEKKDETNMFMLFSSCCGERKENLCIKHLQDVSFSFWCIFSLSRQLSTFMYKSILPL